MSTLSLSPHLPDRLPVPRRFSRSTLWHGLVEALTWLILIGMVSTVSAGQYGSSSYTLAVIAAGIAVSFIRRRTSARLTFFTALIELLTLFLVTSVASNPVRNGLTDVIVSLAVWVAIEAIRAWFWQPTLVIGALGRIVLLIAIGVVIDGRTMPSLPLAPGLVVWAAAELSWSLIARALATRAPLNYRLTRRQVTVVTVTGIALLAAFIASAVFTYTTILYHGQTVSMDVLRVQWPDMYCITYPWKIAGLNISQIGFAGTTECFDTEAELRQAAATREYVARRGFSDETP